MGLEDQRGALLEELKEHAFHFGRVTLSSGAVSDYYINCRAVTLSPRGAWLTANVILDAIQDLDVQAVGGPTVAADPIAAAVAVESWHRNTPRRAFIVRKDAKAHGLQRQVEGPIQSGDRVVVVDDVLTTGGSLLQAIETVEAEGMTVVAVVVLLDRLQGGAERLRERGYVLRSIFTLDDVHDFVESRRHAS
jgi:orotate phosphoribosyltransferase